MAGELKAVVQEMLDALGTKDTSWVSRKVAGDAQGIDEISRKWMRGQTAVAEYMQQLVGMVDGVRSDMHDVHELIFGEIGVVTFWLEQDYTLEGHQQHVSAPSTALLRREEGEWKMLLFHSIPLPPEV